MSKRQPVTVFPTVGATQVCVDDDFVSIEQDDYTGNGDRLTVDIPRPMFPIVLAAIFQQLNTNELRSIASRITASKGPRKA